jgi:nucleoside-diphosphate-sugar epimerase
MRILVTGAAGFVGSHVVAELVSRGHAVWGIDAFRPSYPRERKEQFVSLAQCAGTWECEDRTISTLSARELADVEAVIHLAGQADVRESWDSFSTHVDDNLTETNHLANIVAAAGVPRVVYASTSSIYGEAQSYPIRETAMATPQNPYGVSKLAGEHVLGAHAMRSGFSVVALRLFTVFGPGQRAGMAIERLINSALTGREFTMFGDGEQQRDFLYVADVARAFAAGVDVTLGAGLIPLNIGWNSVVSLRKLIELVEAATGLPIAVTEVAANRGEPLRTDAAIAEAHRILGWRPLISLNQGIAYQVAFARNENYANWAAGLTLD